MHDNDIGYMSFDPGQIEQNAWDDGFEDGMNEILGLIDKFQGKKNEWKGLGEDTVYLIKKAAIDDLKNYIELNRPRREK